jgi:succinylglutamate desuccinylase
VTAKLTELEDLPPGLLERPARELYQILDGPTLIHLTGRQPEPLFVTVLTHGNEDTGWEALRGLLGRYAGQTLPRALSLFIGNVAAARHGLRHLDGQPDYNRVWRGEGTPEHAMMRQVVERMRARGVFASIDIHNNTGLNPHYACINRLERPFLHLATLFSRTVVYFIRPDSVQSMAFSRVCPAVTVECGKPGQRHGVDHVLDFVEAALHLTAFPEHDVPAQDYDLFHTVATVTVPAELTFGFDAAPENDLVFPSDIDRLNFRELPAGTALAQVTNGQARFEVRDEAGNEVADRYFVREEGELRTRVPVMPSMLSLDARVIRQDCLCYLMERLPGASQTTEDPTGPGAPPGP